MWESLSSSIKFQDLASKTGTAAFQGFRGQKHSLFSEMVSEQLYQISGKWCGIWSQFGQLNQDVCL